MGVGVGPGISFWCVLKLSEWNESFFGNFWGPPNLSSSCDNNYSYFKHESFKSLISRRYKMMKKPLRIHAKSLSDALAPSTKRFACSAGLRRLCEDSAFMAGVTIVCRIFARKASALSPCSVAICSFSPQQFHCYLYFSTVSWQYQKYWSIHAKLIDNFSHESDVTSLKTPF